MSLPGSSSGAGQPEGDTTLMTAMMVVMGILAVATAIILSLRLHDFYGKFLWDFSSK